MTIDWTVTAVYNTIMSVSVGVALLLIINFLKKLRAKKVNHLDGWAIAFGILGFILTATGLHMTLTWPLSKIGFPFDDIIFGEPTLAFGLMLLGVAILMWRKDNQFHRDAGIDTSDSKRISEAFLDQVNGLIKPLAWFGAAMGLACIAIAIAGVRFQLFAAPPEEPISGLLADYPIVEAIFISALYAIVGIGAICFPFALKEKPSKGVLKTIGGCMRIGGFAFLVFGAMNYFTHIGLIVNTMD